METSQTSSDALLRFAALVEEMITRETEQEIFGILTEQLPKILPASRASIHLYCFRTKRIQTVGLFENVAGTPAKIDGTWMDSMVDFDQYVAGRRRPSINLTSDAQGNVLYEHLHSRGIVSTMNAPLLVASELMGSINLGSTDTIYTHAELNLLNRVATMTATFMLRSRQLQTINRETDRQRDYSSKLELLNSLSTNLSLVADLPTALEQIARTGEELIDADRVSYCELTEDAKSVVISGLVADSTDAVGITIPIEECGFDSVFSTGEALYRKLESTSQHRGSASLYKSGFRHIWSLPIHSKGRVRAVLNLATKNAGLDIENTNAVVKTLGQLLSMTVERVDAQAEIEKKHQQMEILARTDSLTGLANRLEFENQLTHAIESAQAASSEFYVVYFDIDWFKNINDSMGHTVGDSLLCIVAKRLKARLHKEDLAARIGGDEFLLLIKRNPDTGNLNSYLEKVREELKKPVTLAGQEIGLTLSMGVVIYPEHGTTAVELVKNSDIAMYEAKRSGRDRISFFNNDLSVAIQRKLTLETALKKAVADNQLYMVYQPKYDCQTQTVTGLEALIRWEHPSEGLIGPDIFIPIAEEGQLMPAITEFVLASSLADMGLFRKFNANLKLAVNVSAVEFESQSSLLKRITRAIDASGLSPEVLEIELTETALLRKPQQAQALIESLAEQGFSIALDDFGTGYASLTHLTSLPIDTIKIDRSFVDGLLDDSGKQAVVDGVTTMANRMQAHIVAEGVETEEQLQWLLSNGCRTVQGYLISKPLHRDDMLEFLQQSSFRSAA